MQKNINKRKRILEVIKNHVGEENAISKYSLALTGISVRRVREHVNELRKIGNCILSSSQSKGYYFPASGTQGIFEARRFVVECQSRIEEINMIMQPAIDYLEMYDTLDIAS